MVAHRRFVLLGIGGVIALVVAVTVISLNDNLTYYLYPTEAYEQRAQFPDGERFKLAGLVESDTIVESEGRMTFDVTDGGATVPVILTGSPPTLFGEDVPVVLEGAWNESVFEADNALIRHDENYKIPEEGNYPGD